ncbi:glutathione peroxidase [Mucilaginibacter sp. Bleaf8]|uniref:glutathione peroxidase n=1 Tax=Mucilaginibacter sp. Bleaf8 TaxID=2834430 RepID=UPI001BD1A177|nr:glutathione peroxidase [Mucilaginibacter sp. Bleaf8]MBS7564605.1 glutathione peroxidase [Mucilaginibacter sp. Bleaf8]
MDEHSIYRFSVTKLNGEEINLNNYRDKVLLIVNTASQCGFTPQLKQLEDLRNEFEGQDFEILAFPSNDFGRQEPLDGSSIGKFCKINFGAHFPVFGKVKVKGEDAHPLFKFLGSKKQNGKVQSAPLWNFHKYLINRNGEVIDYFYPFTKPTAARLKRRIAQLIAEQPEIHTQAC